MNRSIGRKIVRTICNGQRFNYETEEMEDFYYELEGMFTPQGATKKLQRISDDVTITINNTEYEEHYYKMPLETFIAYAERIY